MPENESGQSSSRDQSLKSQAELEPIVLPPPGTVYANNLALGMTAFDISIIFGEALGVKDGRTVIQQRVKVMMSPLLAKLLARSVTESVAQYEGQFGEIKEPEGVGTIIVKS